mgnify:CR=1 FL=1
MVLVVDIGNTDTKFGIFVDDELKARWAIHSDLNRNADEHAVLLKAMLAHIGGYDIEAEKFANVRSWLVVLFVPSEEEILEMLMHL